MTSSASILHRFVPTYLSEPDLATLPTAASARQTPAAVLMADIVGYTALTERWSRRGTDEAERLGVALRDLFACIEQAVLAHGGDIFSFAGDSVLALWPVPSDAELAAAVHRSTTAALAVQAALRRLPASQGDPPLRLRLAVSAGNAALCVVGGHNGQWRCFAAGDAVLEAAGGTVAGPPESVCCAPSAWRLLRGAVAGIPLQAGFVQLHPQASLRPGHAAEPAPTFEAAATAGTITDRASDGLRRFVPDLVVQQLDAGHGDWLAEFRTVTTMFVGLRASSSSARLELDAMQGAISDIQAVVDHQEGAVTRVGCDDKGVHALCVWGVPGRLHEDDAARAVRAALDLRSQVAAHGLLPAIGIATGRSLCGLSGGRIRCEYTVSGATVNLAAHLMAAAQDEVLCDGITQLAVGPWTFQRLTRTITKVQQARQPVWSVLSADHIGSHIGSRGSVVVDGASLVQPRALAGRSAELYRLQSLMVGLAAGRGGAAVVEGPAGAGKSALVQAALADARLHGVRVIAATALSIEHRTAYFPWREILPQMLDLPADAPQTALRDRLLARCASQPRLQQWLPVLEDVLPTGLPNTVETLRMNESARADSVAEIFIHLVGQVAERGPTVLVFDDVHWLDSASAALAMRVRIACEKLLLLIVTRDADSLADKGQANELRQRLPSYADVTVVDVGPLSRSDTHELLLQTIDATAVDPALLDLVHTHTEGHALFTVEAIKSLLESGTVAVQDGYARLADQVADTSRIVLPASVDKLIASRFDRMPLAHQLTLKVASVLGVAFAPEVLARVHPTTTLTADIAHQLTQVEESGLVAHAAHRVPTNPNTPDRPDDVDVTDRGFVFTHAITRDVIYGLLPFSQRRLLHAAVAREIEAAHPNATDTVLPLLAHHWSLSDDTPKALNYLYKAGEQSFVRHGYREAVGFLRQALALLDSGSGQEQVPLRGLCERLLGHAWVGLGNLTEGRRYLERSLALLGRPVPRTRWGLIGGAAFEGAVQTGVRLLAWRRSPATETSQGVFATDAHALFRLGNVAWFQSDALVLLYAGLRGVNIAERDGPSLDLARFFAGMATIVGAAGMRRQAGRYLNLSAAVAQRLDDPAAAALVGMFSAMYWIGVADWKRALPSIEAAINLSQQAGDNRQLDECAAIAAFVCMHSGRLGRATALFEDCVQRGRARGDAQTTAWGLLGVARVHILQGAFDAARGPLATVAPLVADWHSAIELHGQRALVLLHARDWQDCERDAERALRLIRQSRPLSFSTLIGTAAVAEVYLTLSAHAAESGDRAQAKAYAGQARASLAGLRKFAGVFPIGRPLLLLLQGQQCAMAGYDNKALTHWRRAGEAAAELDLPYERACVDRALRGRRRSASVFLSAPASPVSET